MSHGGRAGKSASELKKWRAAAVAAAFLAVAAFAAWYWYPGTVSEPEITPEEEVRGRFRKNFDPEESTLSRYYSIRSELLSDRRFSVDARRQMAVEMLAESVSLSFSDFAKLPPDKKAGRAAVLREDAWRTMVFFRCLPKKKQREAVSRISSTPGGRAQIDRAVDVLTNELSPADREMLGPAIRIWKNILEGKTR